MWRSCAGLRQVLFALSWACRAIPKTALGERVGRNTESELAVIFIGRVAHHLVQAGRIQVAKQAAEHMRMAQSGVSGEVKRRGRDVDGNVGGVDGDRANVGDIGAFKRMTGAGFLIELFVTLVHERARRTYSQVSLRDLPVHHLTLVKLRSPESAACCGRDLYQLIKRPPCRPDRYAAMFLRHETKGREHIGRTSTARFWLEQVPDE